MQTQQIWTLSQAQDLLGFMASSCSGAIWHRAQPDGSAALLDRLLEEIGEFGQDLTPEQVAPTLKKALPDSFWRDPLGSDWLTDVVELCRVFCQEIGASACRVQLHQDRPCVRFHADNVPVRLVCAYRGPGTLWLTEDNLDLVAAETRGTNNHAIARRVEDVRQLHEWEVLVMKGRASNAIPLYHKSPEPRPGDPKSLVLKLDVISAGG